MHNQDLVELMKEGQSYLKRMEKDILDAAIENGLLPEPTKLTSLEICIYAQEVDKEFVKREGRGISIDDMKAAWWRTQYRIAQMSPEEKWFFGVVLKEYQDKGEVTGADLPQVWTESRKLWQQFQKQLAEAPTPPPAPVEPEETQTSPSLAAGERSRAKGETAENRPPIPGMDGKTWDDTFDWYYHNRDICRTQKDLAERIAVAYGTVRNEHSKYIAQHGNIKEMSFKK
jgi:hypothetical protein